MALLVLTATSTEEWEVSRDGDVALGETHEVLPAIKSALQSDGDLEIASIAAGDGEKPGPETPRRGEAKHF